MPIIPSSQTFDQSTIRHLLDVDPVVQRYRTFLALFNWALVPEPVIKPSQSGRRPHPHSAYLKAFLLKRNEGFASCTQVRRFLLEHSLLVLELGFRPVLDVRQPYGFDVAHTVPTARWLREQQRTLDQSVLQDLLAATVQECKRDTDREPLAHHPQSLPAAYSGLHQLGASTPWDHSLSLAGRTR